MSGPSTPRRVLSFDGDGTLWDFESAMMYALARAADQLAAAGVSTPSGPVSADWLRQVRDEVARGSRYGGQPMENIRFASFEEALARCGRTDRRLAVDIYDTYMALRFDLLRAYPEVPAVLAELGTAYRLVLVTNGNTHPGRLDLDEAFEVVVIGAECELYKPDPAIFRYAAAQLGVPASEVLHVGDDPVEDVAAAQLAGMDAVWLNRSGRAWPLDYPAPAVIADLAGLSVLLS